MRRVMWIGILGVLLVVLSLLPIFIPDQIPNAKLFTNVQTIFSASLALIGITHMRYSLATLNRRWGQVWWWLVLGVWLWFSGEVIYGYTELVLEQEPFPSFADVAYVLGFAAFIVGLGKASMSIKRVVSRAETIFLFAFTVLASGAIALVLAPVIGDEAPLLEKALIIIYPTGDLMMGVMAVYIFLAFFRSPMGLAWGPFLLGFLLFAVSDAMLGYLSLQDLYYTGNPFDYLYTLGYVVWFVGALFFEALAKEGTPGGPGVRKAMV